VAETVPWTLESTGADRLPKIVYIRFVFLGTESHWDTYVDDIVLDETEPEMLMARLVDPSRAGEGDRASRVRPKRTLLVRADDRVSGVVAMQVARRPSRAPAWGDFRRRISVGWARGPVFVRVRDAAGNVSRWRRAR
jgi:hypothetical protein